MFLAAVYSEGNVSPFGFYFATAEELIIQERSRVDSPGSADFSTSFCFGDDSQGWCGVLDIDF